MYGLYIHIPFCRKKCNYCDFVSQAAEPETVAAYINALCREMRRYRDLSVGTIFVGGGTPTVLATTLFEELFDGIRRTFDCRATEITVEANPESLSDGKLEVLGDLGVNRLSIGVQSLCDRELETLGRIHTSGDFRNVYRRAREAGFGNINIDLIYGLPGQKLEEWQTTLRGAVECRSEHLSLYPLTIEEGTPFFERGSAVDEAAQAAMYEWSQGFLGENGYGHYEISNWARPGFECRHNLTYWENREYVGLGVAAASYYRGRRFKNTGDIAAYIDAMKDGREALAESEEIDEATRLSEEIILRLRCMKGLTVTDRVRGKYGATIEKLVRDGLLETAGEQIRLTKRGLLLANQVMQEFV